MYSMASPSDPSPSDLSSSEPRTSATTSATLPGLYEAAHAVSNTNELICEIIGYLPLKDIVIITSVCRTWRYALKASVAIQQALFLAPINIGRITTRKEHLPKLVKDLPRAYYMVVGEVNPSLARICGPVLSNDDETVNPRLLGTMSPRVNFEHPAGIWRDMFITQPPTSLVRLYLYPKETSRRTFAGTLDFVPELDEVYPYRRNGGIRMGQLHDFIESRAQARQKEKRTSGGRTFAVRVVMPDFHPEHTPSQKHHDWFWEVGEGKVIREILPHSGCELSKDKAEDGVELQ
jgi:hypothetical protein